MLLRRVRRESHEIRPSRRFTPRRSAIILRPKFPDHFRRVREARRYVGLRKLAMASVLATEDRRLWHPAGRAAPAGSVFRRDRRILIPKARLKVAPRPLLSSLADENLSHRVGFAVPHRVALCVRRKIRKEVMHAKGKAGGTGFRPPRRNFNSQVEC